MAKSSPPSDIDTGCFKRSCVCRRSDRRRWCWRGRRASLSGNSLAKSPGAAVRSGAWAARADALPAEEDRPIGIWVGARSGVREIAGGLLTPGTHALDEI